MDNPPRHSCLSVVYFVLFKVGITGVLSASVLFLCLGIGLGSRTAVWRYIVRLASYHKGYCETRGGFISTWVYFHFFYFLGRVGIKIKWTYITIVILSSITLTRSTSPKPL
jgi:hypothetical protein